MVSIGLTSCLCALSERSYSLWIRSASFIICSRVKYAVCCLGSVCGLGGVGGEGFGSVGFLSSLNLGKLIVDSFHCIFITQLTAPDRDKFTVLIGKIWVTVGYGVALNTALHMIMLHQGIDHIF